MQFGQKITLVMIFCDVKKDFLTLGYFVHYGKTFYRE